MANQDRIRRRRGRHRLRRSRCQAGLALAPEPPEPEDALPRRTPSPGHRRRPLARRRRDRLPFVGRVQIVEHGDHLKRADPATATRRTRMGELSLVDDSTTDPAPRGSGAPTRCWPRDAQPLQPPGAAIDSACASERPCHTCHGCGRPETVDRPLRRGNYWPGALSLGNTVASRKVIASCRSNGGSVSVPATQSNSVPKYPL